MRRDRWIQLAAVGVMAACLAASGLVAMQVAASLGRNRLVYTDRAEDGDPPQVALGIAMGAFRGLFVNFLWMRANDLKQAGKYYEAVDLASTITKLQPRFPRVWAFHAWNLAYNISVATNTPQERWNWVQAGIRLLRDEGIPNNPNDLLLHKELAWTFLHKVQGTMDDSNFFYKRAHAREWTVVLGPPPRRTAQVMTTEVLTNEYVKWLERIANAKDTLAEVVAAEPKAGVIVERLKKEAGWDPDLRVLALVEEYRSLSRMRAALGLAGERPDVNQAVVAMLADKEFAPGWTALVPHIRKRVLIDTYHMEPDRMVRYTKQYGPLDWRHPAAHAVYWGARGVEEALLRAEDWNQSDYDFLNTDRVVIQALQELYRTGEVWFDYLNPNFLMQLPSVDFIPAYGRSLEAMIKRGGVFTDPVKRVYTSYAAGYENLLADAVRFLYRRGQLKEAEEYYKMGREFPWQNIHETNRVARWSVPIDEFVINEIKDEDRFTSPSVALQEVAGALWSAYMNGLLMGNMDMFRRNFEYGRRFHAEYIKTQVFNTAVNQGDTARQEVFPRDFEKYAGQMMALLAAQAGVPDGAIVYKRAPEDLKVRAYVWLENMPIKDEMKRDGVDFEVWFPPPDEKLLNAYRAKVKAEEATDAEKGKIEAK